jgi:hypothetical protein
MDNILTEDEAQALQESDAQPTMPSLEDIGQMFLDSL